MTTTFNNSMKVILRYDGVKEINKKMHVQKLSNWKVSTKNIQQLNTNLFRKLGDKICIFTYIWKLRCKQKEEKENKERKREKRGPQS